MSHNHDHQHYRADDNRRMTIVLGINAVMLAAGVIGAHA